MHDATKKRLHELIFKQGLVDFFDELISLDDLGLALPRFFLSILVDLDQIQNIIDLLDELLLLLEVNHIV